MPKYIETALPLAEINDAPIREKASARGHPANLHMWWKLSPIASALAALASAVMDFTEETAEQDLALIAKLASGDKKALETIRSSLSEKACLPRVWDAFAGFGGIPIAAQKLGLSAAANDLNPVAAMLTKAAADIPARFTGQPPVHPGKLKRTAYSGAQGPAEDVQFYGEWLENQALKLLSDAYPRTESGDIPCAWIWVRTVKCPNPACNCRIPLGSSYVLSTSKSAPYWAEPVVKNGELRFEIHEGDCPRDKESNKAGGSGARFRCPGCAEITTDEYIKKMGAAHALGAQMLAVMTNTDGKLTAGFGINAVWPMRSKPVSEKADSTRVLIVARKDTDRRGQSTRRGFINTLKRELPEKLTGLWLAHVQPEDELLSYLGQGLSVFSAYESVLNADGSAMSVHDALQVIYPEYEDYIEQRKTAFSENAAESKDE